eukprot:1944414-Amphidinium_carterae.1
MSFPRRKYFHSFSAVFIWDLGKGPGETAAWRNLGESSPRKCSFAVLYYEDSKVNLPGFLLTQVGAYTHTHTHTLLAKTLHQQ